MKCTDNGLERSFYTEREWLRLQQKEAEEKEESAEELAKKMGLSQSAISNKLRLLSLSPNVQEALMNGKISERHARSLLALDDLEAQDAWLNIVLNERLTVKELDKRLKNAKFSKEEEDVPIIRENPNFEKIRATAQDITTVTPEVVVPEEKKDVKIPNTFFNFLEKEEANMNPFETEAFEEAPSENIMDLVKDDTPEIELLDFMPKVETKDMSKAHELVEELNKSLKESGYVASITSDDSGNEIKYTILIQKN